MARNHNEVIVKQEYPDMQDNGPMGPPSGFGHRTQIISQESHRFENGQASNDGDNRNHKIRKQRVRKQRVKKSAAEYCRQYRIRKMAQFEELERQNEDLNVHNQELRSINEQLTRINQYQSQAIEDLKYQLSVAQVKLKEISNIVSRG